MRKVVALESVDESWELQLHLTDSPLDEYDALLHSICMGSEFHFFLILKQ